MEKQLGSDINEQKAIDGVKHIQKMGKRKSRSEGEDVQIKFPNPTKAKSQSKKGGGWKHGSWGRVLQMKKVA